MYDYCRLNLDHEHLDGALDDYSSAGWRVHTIIQRQNSMTLSFVVLLERER